MHGAKIVENVRVTGFEMKDGRILKVKTTLGDIAAWSADLGPEAAQIRFWFVTVDPERDTVGMLRDYLSWNPNMTGAAGSSEEVAKAVAAFRVYARRIPLEDGDYTVEVDAAGVKTSCVVKIDGASKNLGFIKLEKAR